MWPLGRSAKKRALLLVAGGSPFSQPAGPLCAKLMSEPKSRLITICMLVGAVAMIGLVLTGILQIKVARAPVAQVVAR